MNTRICIGLIMFIHVAFVLAAQNGYKQFKWGENIDSVKSKSSSFEEDEYGGNFEGFWIAYYMQYGNLGSSAELSNPLNISESKFSTYVDKDKDMSFLFADDKLVAVRLVFQSSPNDKQKVISQLEQKYGVSPSKSVTHGSLTLKIKSWLNRQGRLVTYQYTDMGMGIELETVDYIDQTFYNKVAGKLKTIQQQALNARHNEIKGKIE